MEQMLQGVRRDGLMEQMLQGSEHEALMERMLHTAGSDGLVLVLLVPRLSYCTSWFQHALGQKTGDERLPAPPCTAMKKHAEHIANLELTMHTICELILDWRPKGEEPRSATQKSRGPSPQMRLPPSSEVVMHGEPFPMPPRTPELLALQPVQSQPAEQRQDMPILSRDCNHHQRLSWPASRFPFRPLRTNFWRSWMLHIAAATTSITTNILSIK